MLSELYIENLAVIEKATIDFSNKLNVSQAKREQVSPYL